MKKNYLVSLCNNGIIGGNLQLDNEKMIYHTNKLIISEDYKNIKIYYKDIIDIKYKWLIIIPIVNIILKNKKEYKFIIYNIKKFKRNINSNNIFFNNDKIIDIEE